MFVATAQYYLCHCVATPLAAVAECIARLQRQLGKKYSRAPSFDAKRTNATGLR
jgi:hypothetical protein